MAEPGGFQVLFRIPGRISLSASEGAKSLRVASATVAPELTVHAVPVLDAIAFLVASFTQAEDAPLLPGRVSIYRDGGFVGRGRWALPSRTKTFGSASAPMRRSRSPAPSSNATRGRPA